MPKGDTNRKKRAVKPAAGISVRASRDGDQFHYLWAARRCLTLLSPDSEVVAIAIEGASPSENQPGLRNVGEDVIDLAEYLGSEDLAGASCVRYMQFKHSTLHPTKPWVLSGLKKTLEEFAKRYSKLEQDGLAQKVEFSFVTNRPIESYILETLADLGQGTPPRHPDWARKMGELTKLDTGFVAAFYSAVSFVPDQDDYWDQRNLLFQDAAGYLPEADYDAPVQLKELVTRKALSEAVGKNVIRRADLLHAFNTLEDRLFPAPCRIDQVANAVPREQEPELIETIIRAADVPVIIRNSSGRAGILE